MVARGKSESSVRRSGAAMMIGKITGRYCNFCARKLQLPHFATVTDANGDAVRVHKHCADEARRFWHGPYPTAQEREAVRV
jgi:hypothetical protein